MNESAELLTPYGAKNSVLPMENQLPADAGASQWLIRAAGSDVVDSYSAS